MINSKQVLLWLVAAPAYILLLASRVGSDTMQRSDIICSRALMGLILIEFFADQQQWSKNIHQHFTHLYFSNLIRLTAYQETKRKYRATAKVPADSKFTQEDLDRGFNVSGLWSWSRHPNFLAEQLVWVTLYQWSALATDTHYNWTVVGALGYLAVFQGSTWLTELLSSKKYPEYAEYQRLVGRFFPKILPSSGGSLDEVVAKKTSPAAAKKGASKKDK